MTLPTRTKPEPSEPSQASTPDLPTTASHLQLESFTFHSHTNIYLFNRPEGASQTPTMAYLLYSLTFLVFLSGTLLYLTRAHWLASFTDQIQDLGSRLRYTFTREYLYSRLPSSFVSNSFADDVEAGLSSSTFDLGANMEGGDSRAGLDDAAKREILRIMKKRRLDFDRARKVYLERRFADNGIGADGRPRDPKFVSFS